MSSSISTFSRPSPAIAAIWILFRTSPRDGLPGGVQNRCPICARFRAIVGTVEGIPGRFVNFCHIFSLSVLLLLRNEIPALNDESHDKLNLERHYWKDFKIAYKVMRASLREVHTVTARPHNGRRPRALLATIHDVAATDEGTCPRVVLPPSNVGTWTRS